MLNKFDPKAQVGRQPSRIPREVDAEQTRRLGYKIVDLIADELADPCRRPALPTGADFEELDELLGGALPEEETDFEEILSLISNVILENSPNNSNPNLFCNISAGALPVPSLISALVSTLRLYCINWTSSPASSILEVTTVRWLGQFIGYDDEAAGYITSGGTSANLMALVTARCSVTEGRTNLSGNTFEPRLTAYISEAGHDCFVQSMRMMGLGSKQLRRIPTDEANRIRLDLLENKICADIKAGCRPFCVIGVAGTTEFGSIDDLHALADIAKRFGAWFHVDGAYGAFAASQENLRADFHGLKLADSIVCDPHKWMNVPLEAGVLLTKEWRHLKDAFFMETPCMNSIEDDAEHNQWQHGYELTRSDRGFKVWLALRLYGASAFRSMIASHISLAAQLADMVKESPYLEIIVPPGLSVCCFRFTHPDIANDDEAISQVNREIEARMRCEGGAAIGSIVHKGRVALRTCFVSYRIDLSSVRPMVESVERTGVAVTNEFLGIDRGQCRSEASVESVE